MDNPGPGQGGVVWIMVQQGVQYGAGVIAGRRVDDQIGRFVNDNDVVVLVDNGQRYVFAGPCGVAGNRY